MKRFLISAINLLIGSPADLPDFSQFSLGKPSSKRYTDRQLLTLESEIGSQLFGEVPKGHRREFFCLDDKTWIWHEEWVDEDDKRQVATTRYEVQPQGILKVQEGARYNYIEGDELNHLISAIQMYYDRVTRELYERDPRTGLKLA